MGVDLSQFHQVFIEESIEGLDVMESALMELDPDNIESEAINAIFRSAHSIKGGGATFGFTALAEFTHVLETVLDQIRSGQRGMSADDVNLFLQSVDCMREMIALLQDNRNSTTDFSTKLKARFEDLLTAENKPTVAGPPPKVPSKENSELAGWKIYFKPGRDILRTGNDPMRIFSALADLVAIDVALDNTQCPSIAHMDPEELHLSWVISVCGNIARETLLEQFEWVLEESEIIIEPLPVSPAGLVKTAKNIEFIPHREILLSGNDPMRMLQELRDLDSGILVKARVDLIPNLKLLDPEHCFIAWDLAISDAIEDQDIRSLFEWVMDDVTLNITHIDVEQNLIITQKQAETRVEDALVPEQVVPQLDESRRHTTSKIDNKLASPKKAAQSEASSIRVGIDKIDNLINMVGELVITQSMLGQLGTEFELNKMPKLLEGLSQLEQNTRELQESVMRIRMLPISFAFSRFPRMARDLGQQLGKKIHLEMLGEQTELDKTVMEKIGDPLVHLVRNAIDHGIEPSVDRVRCGKSETGKITLNAYHQGGNVIIEIVDDGKGLDRYVILQKAIEKGLVGELDCNTMSDEAVFDLIFLPGFSTAKEVSDVSGRGVGMDVVKRNIQALNGVVEIQSKKSEGSKIRIRLPLTLAILDGQLVRVGANIYVFPLVSIVESLQIPKDLVNHIAGSHSVFRLRDDYVPIIRLDEVFATEASFEALDQDLVVVVEADGEKVAIVVDDLLAQQQVVIKSLEQNYRRIEGVSGATILGDGTVALIVDIPGVVKLAGTDNAQTLVQPVGQSQTSLSVISQRA